MLPTSSLPAIFVFSFLVAIGAVISPGPISTAIVSQAPRRGWLVGPLVSTGHSLLELLMVFLIVVGLGSVLAHERVQVVIAFVGAGLLVWMGASLVWSTWRGRVELPSRGDGFEPLSTRRLIGIGLAATASNPFWYAWWVTVAAGYLAQARTVSMAAVLAFYAGHISADFAWNTILSTVVGGGRRWMTAAIYRGLLVACGLFFLYLGWVFLSQGIAGFKAL